jgi:hypothetical protein
VAWRLWLWRVANKPHVVRSQARPRAHRSRTLMPSYDSYLPRVRLAWHVTHGTSTHGTRSRD